MTNVPMRTQFTLHLNQTFKEYYYFFNINYQF